MCMVPVTPVVAVVTAKVKFSLCASTVSTHSKQILQC